jgi:transposase
MSKYSVKLSQEQRAQLEAIVKTGKSPAREIMHAQILLKTDSGEQGPRWSQEQIQAVFGVGITTVKRVRHAFVEHGLETAIKRKKRVEEAKMRKVDGMQEAYIIAMMCMQKPDGQERWTLRGITKRAIELEIVEQVSHETIRQVLRKNKLKPWQKKQWCVGPQADGNYVFRMENVLNEYVQPYDPKRPRVCFDEGSVQFTADKREALEMKPGSVKKEDYQYDHGGYCSIFLACEPLAGKRIVHVSRRRTKREFALFIRHLVDVEYPEAEKIIIIMDNLNTHTLGSLYEVFSAEEAMRIWKKIEIHYTPIHGSWLNMAEIELSVLGRQVLHERLGTIELVEQRVAAWQVKRNALKMKIVWRFKAEDARIRLAHLYPNFEEYDAGQTPSVEEILADE